MKNSTIMFLLAVAFIVGGVVAVGLSKGASQDGHVGGGFSVANRFFFVASTATSGTLAAGEPSATTSPLYMSSTATASSTLVSFLANGEQIDLNLSLTASSTSAKLAWSNKFSIDGVNYYDEDCSTLDSAISITHGPGQCVNYWTPGTTSTSTKNVTIKNTGARFVKTLFGVMGANGALHAMSVPREPTQN